MLLRTGRFMLLVPFAVISLLVGASVLLAALMVPARRPRLQALLTMWWCRALCRLFGVRVIRSGFRRDAGRFTVCNHISYIDVFVMGSIRPTAFLARHDMREWPLMGWLSRLGGTVFVNRKSKRDALKAIACIKEKLGSKVSVVIFPEGTTSDGSSVRPFKSTFFDVAAAAALPVVPVSINYQASRLNDIAWHGDAPLLAHVWNLAGCRAIKVHLKFGAPIDFSRGELALNDTRKRLSRMAHEAVSAGLRNIK